MLIIYLETFDKTFYLNNLLWKGGGTMSRRRDFFSRIGASFLGVYREGRFPGEDGYRRYPDEDEGYFAYSYDHYNPDGSRKRPRKETNVSFEATTEMLKRHIHMKEGETCSTGGDNTSGFTPNQEPKECP